MYNLPSSLLSGHLTSPPSSDPIPVHQQTSVQFNYRPPSSRTRRAEYIFYQTLYLLMIPSPPTKVPYIRSIVVTPHHQCLFLLISSPPTAHQTLFQFISSPILFIITSQIVIRPYYSSFEIPPSADPIPVHYTPPHQQSRSYYRLLIKDPIIINYTLTSHQQTLYQYNYRHPPSLDPIPVHQHPYIIYY